jgi:glycosyltransferase involved in cell wall biosynthesis
LNVPQKIGFGCSVLERGLALDELDGIGIYTLELGRALAARGNRELVPTIFGATSSRVANLFGNEKPLRLKRFAASALGTAFSGVSLFEGHKARKRISLYHATDHLIPKLRGVPVVATIMDAIPLSHPHWIRQNQAALKRWLFRRTASWAQHIITISEFSKREIVEHFNIPAERISVTPLGVDARYFEKVEETVCKSVLEKYRLPPHCFLFVGTLQPRKNVETLLAAHEQLPETVRRLHPLVIVGRAGWRCEELIASMAKQHNAGKVFWLKYVSDLEKRALMSSALSLTFLSLYEGFGLPIVEAFAARLPVITSNTSALFEIAKGAALTVNPHEAPAIAHAMEQIANDTPLRSLLIETGLKIVEQYRWPQCAERTDTIYNSLLS